MIELDIATSATADLIAGRDRIDKELQRRETLANAETNMKHQLLEYKRAVGREDGQPWRPYDGTLASVYAEGEIVVHAHKAWKSRINNNVWEPGIRDLWEELTGEIPTPDPIEAEPWKPNEQVSIGDIREYEGAIYRVAQAHTTQVGYEPPIVPALWTLIQEANND